MKKLFLILLIISTTLFTGCMKNYKTVSEYSSAMNEVKEKLGDYTIEAELSSNGKEVYVKSFIKGKLWKTEVSQDNGNSYDAGILYDGKEVLSYDKKTKYAIAIPFKNMFKKTAKIQDDKVVEAVMKVLNPVGVLLSWNFEEFGGNIDDAWKFGKVVKMNNYQCRMLNSTVTQDEVCVDDKYGIAVYAKFTDDKNKTIIINAKNIDNTPISDSNLNLPQGIRKMSMANFFQSMANMMKSMN